MNEFSSLNSTPQQSSITSRMKNGWSSMPRTRKIVLTVGIIALIATMSYLSISLGQGDYVPLYSNLDYKQAGEIKISLEEQGVTNYKIGENGTSILVPRTEVDRLRMELAVNGLTPDSGTGWELFDDTSQLGLTEQARSIMYQRALEGELRRSIESLSAVDEARVHLNLQEQSVFLTESAPSSASIVLKLNRNASLTDSQIKGIMSLVAGGVENLSLDNIDVIDSQGNLLSSGFNSSDAMASAGDRIAQEVNYETHLQEKLQSQLGKVFGYDKVAISVRVNLSQVSEEQRTEEYIEGPLVSQQTQFNKTEGETTETSDSPLDNNMQNIIVEGDGNVENPDIVDFSQTSNYQTGMSETYTVRPSGEVENISISVIYSGELTDVLQTELERQVTSIAGLNVTRGDIVTVAGIPFNLPEIEDLDLENEGFFASLTTFDYFLYGTLLVTLIAFIIYLVSKSKKTKTEQEKAKQNIFTEFAKMLPQPVEEEEEGPTFINENGQLDPAVENILNGVRIFFEQNPDESLDLLRVWMADQRPVELDKLGKKKKQSVEPAELSGMEKAARLLVFLGRNITSDVMKACSQDEIVKLAHVISSIKSVPFEESLQLVEEFSEMIDAHRFMAQGGFDFAKEAMFEALGSDKAEEVLYKVKGAPRVKRPFEVIRHMDPMQLYNALVEEHPQTIALVLCYLSAEKAALIVGQLPEHMKSEVIMRIGMMNNTSAQIVETVEQVIEARLQSLMTGDMTQIGGVSTVVDILNQTDRGSQEQIIDSIELENQRLAEEVRDSLFTFEDLVTLDSVAIQRVIRDIDTNVLAVSLKGASDELVAIIKKNMSTRAAERLGEDIEFLGPLRLKEIEKAQHDIINTVRRLEDAGEIVIAHGGDDDVVY